MNMSIFNSTITNTSKELQSCDILRKALILDRTTGMVVTAVGTSILNALFALFAIGANLLVMLVIYRKGSTRTPADLFIANLSLTDFLVGLLVQPCTVIVRINELVDVHLCTLRTINAFTGYFCCGVSVITLCSFSLDRLTAVAFPYNYNEEASNKKSATVIIMCWLTWLLYTILPFIRVIPNKSYFISLACFIFVAMVTSTTSYIYITIVARRQLKNITSAAQAWQSSSTADARNKSKRKQHWLRAQQKKSFVSIVIASTFALCFIPKVCYLLAFAKQDQTYDVLYIAGKWSSILVFINSSLNPIIYAIRIKEMRQDMITCIQSLRNIICLKRDSLENMHAKQRRSSND